MRSPRLLRSSRPEGRRALRISAALPLASLLCLISAAACGPSGPVAYPDRPGVTAAQAKWCEALAKVNGKGADWERMADCKAAAPTGSATYLKLVAKCVNDQLESASKNTPDIGLIATSCGEEATIKLSGDDALKSEAVAARCRWQVRCAKVTVEDCKAGIEKLDNSQRVVLTSQFNAAAQHTVAECLDDASCSKDEYGTYDRCYKGVTEKLLWYP